MICRFHGGGSYTDTDTRPCPYCEVNEMRPVYEAAMALVQHEIEMMEQGVKNPTDWDKYYDALHDACRRAKGAMACGHSVGSLSDPAPDFIGDRKPSIGTVHCRECEAEAQRRAKEGRC